MDALTLTIGEYIMGKIRIIELKPCPFCGDSATLLGNDNTGYYVFCNSMSCPCELGRDDGSKWYEFCGRYETLDEALNDWNTRYEEKKSWNIWKKLFTSR